MIIPDRDIQFLRVLCRFTPEQHKEEPYLPQDLQDVYCEYKRLLDRIEKSPMPTYTLAWIAMQAGYGKDAPTRQPTVTELHGQSKISHGDQIEVQWHSRWRPAVFKQSHADGKQAMVQIDGQAHERYVDVDRVRVPKAEAVPV
jgi:hypothetical protein